MRNFFEKFITTPTSRAGLTQYHALHTLLHYDAYDPDTQLFINKNSIGWGLQFSPSTGCSEEFVKILTSIFTDVLPKNADVQFLLWASPKIGYAVDAVTEHNAKRDGSFRFLAEKQGDYLQCGAHQSLTTQHDYFLRDLQGYCFFSIPKKFASSSSFSSNEYVQIRHDVMSSMRSIELPSVVVTVERLMALMDEWLNPDCLVYPSTPSWSRYESLSTQMTDPEQQLVVTPNGLYFSKIGKDAGNEKKSVSDVEVRCFCVKQYPKTVAQWGMGEAIGQLFNATLQIPCPYLLSFNVHLLDPEKSKAKVQTKILGKDSKANSQLTKWLPSLNREYKDWQHIRERLTDGDHLVSTLFQVVLFAPNDRVSRCERKVRDLYQANGWSLKSEPYLQLQSFLATLPMSMSEGLYDDMKQFGRQRTMTAFNAANIAPLQGEWKGYDQPLMLLPGRRGQICWWSPFANNQGNYNVSVAANSGRGKSVFVQDYITSLLGSGGRCWVIDIGHSYEKSARLLDGEFIAFDVSSPICLNFFTHITNETIFKEYHPLLVQLIANMARVRTQTTEEEERFIERAIKDAWNAHGEKTTITTVQQTLLSYQDPIADNLAHLLTSYASGGMYAGFFEGECAINFDNPYIVLEMLGLKDKKELQRVVLLALMTRIHIAMYLGERHTYKSCIIDEAWELLGDGAGNAAKFIETGFRTARRHSANFIAITQRISDFFTNDTAKAAFSNSDFTVVLGQKDQDIEALETSKQFPVDAFVKRLMKSLQMVDKAYSECLIHSPHGVSVHRIVLAPYRRILFSSKGSEFEAVKALEAEGLSLEQAVERVAEEQG